MKICHTTGLDVLSSLICPWHPRLLDLTLCDFFLWGYGKDIIYVACLPYYLQEMRQCTNAAVATINSDMLERVWTEMDYWIDNVTWSSHTECF
jgi:hypothetical protein